MKYIPNSLNQYDTYTYNISLYMIRPESIFLMEKNISTGGAVLIADNARLAQYNINNLEQIYVVGHNKVRSTFGNRFSMTIAEANGVTLLDTIRKAASSLGIIDHKLAIYLIQVEFNGRMPNGAARKHPQVFYWPVIIREFQFQVNEGGTTYQIEAVENSTNAYSYLNNVLKSQITIEASTVGDFFDKFNRELNTAAVEAIEFSSDQLYSDTISIDFDDSISSWKQWPFQALTDETTQYGINIIKSGPGGASQLQITVPNGTNLTDLVTVILGLTKEYKNILLSGNGAREFARENPNEDISSKLDQFPVFHKVTANLEYGDYDILRGEYVKSINYRVVPYVIADEIVSATAYVTGITNANIQQRRVANLAAGGWLRKRYDYIFTGNNTEVLEFDIKFDRAYYYITPYGGGQFGDVNRQLPVQSQAPSSVVARFIADISGPRQEISKLNRAKAQAASTFDARARGRGSNAPSSSLSDELGNISNAIRGQVDLLRGAADAFTTSLKDEGYSPEEVALRMRFAQDVINDDDVSGSDNDNRGGMMRFGALQANMDNPADMAIIELGIRGDPFWLGKPNSFYDTGLQDGDELADFERGTNGFFLNMNLPQPDEDLHGRRKPSSEYEVSGYYTVRNVIARYREGQFTMYLSAVRDVGTNTPTALSDLTNEGSSSASTSNSQSIAGLDIAQAAEDAYRRASGTGNT
jgi:hypothetical protein